MKTEKIKPFPKYMPPANDVSCDILIISGTVCGLLTAYHLSAEGYNVCVAEKDRLSPFSVYESRGIISKDGDLLYSEMARLRNIDAEMFRISADNAYRELLTVAKKTGCTSLKERSTLMFTDRISDRKADNEYRLRNFSGNDVALIDSAASREIFSFDMTEGVYARNSAATVDTEEFAGALADYLAVNGVVFFEDTDVTCICSGKTDKFRFVCNTDAEKQIFCNIVIDCRNYSDKSFYTSNSLPQRRSVMYSIRTDPVKDFKGWHEQCIIRDLYRRPMTFCVNSDNSISAFWVRRAYLTGKTRHFGDRYFISYLSEVLRSMFFCIDGLNIVSEQAVAFAQYDGFPVMGRDASMPGFYYAYCGSAKGLIYAEICAENLRTLINGATPEKMIFFR